MENLTFDIEEIYAALCDRARDEGALSREEWDALAETVLEEKREWQEMDDDEDVDAALEALKARFDDFISDVDVV
jgi:hypothetical protein